MRRTEDIKLLPKTDKNESMEILYQARTAYEDRRRFLTKRRRNADFHMGRQWRDKMVDPDTGDIITEEEYIRKQRRVPTQNNQINTVVRNMVGRFRNNYPDPVAFGRNRDKAQAGEVMTSALRRALDINEARELDAREMEEFVISAAAGWKITYKWWAELDTTDVYIEEIDQTRFFFNQDSEDVRTHDVWIVGELHDMRLDDAVAAFARSKSDVKRIKEMFPTAEEWEGQLNTIPGYLKRYKNFYYPDNHDKVRVIEVWRKEKQWLDFVHDMGSGRYFEADQEYLESLGFDEEVIKAYKTQELIDIYNQQQLEAASEQGVDLGVVPMLEFHTRFEDCWKCYFLSPYGDVLMSMRTPYDHQEHPYSFAQFPLIDGETYSMVESIIDQQKHINRLISMLDASLAKSLKNLMFIPETIVPEKYQGNYEAFADQAIQYNGMVFYKPRPDVQLPKVISQNSMPAGAQELLALQMNLMKEISAVNDAVQGLEPKANTPASLYAQRTANASTTNKDYFDFFMSIMRKRNRKVMQVIKQFYTEKRYIKIAGSGFNKGIADVYDPELVREIDFDVIFDEMEDTMAYRQAVDTYLYQFLQGQLITLEEFLEETSMPFADSLLQRIRNRQPQPGMEGQPGANGMSPDMMAMMQQQQQQLPPGAGG